MFALSAFVQPLLSFSSWIHLIALVTQEGITKHEHIPNTLTTLRWSDTEYFALEDFSKLGLE